MSSAFRGYDAWKTTDPSLDADVLCEVQSPDGKFVCNLLTDHQDNDGTSHSHRVERIAYYFVPNCIHCNNGMKKPAMVDGYPACEHDGESPGRWNNTSFYGGSGNWVELATWPISEDDFDEHGRPTKRGKNTS